MLKSPLAPYLYWAKTRPAAEFDLAGSNLLAATLDDLPGARDAVELTAPDRGGFPPLVEAIGAHYGVASDRVVTALGCSAANFLAIGALVGPGDSVLMELPGYDQISGACELLGARVETFGRRFEDGYRVDVDAIRSRITESTRLVIITSPHNPSGRAADRATLLALQSMADATDVHVLVDEVYLEREAAVARVAFDEVVIETLGVARRTGEPGGGTGPDRDDQALRDLGGRQFPQPAGGDRQREREDGAARGDARTPGFRDPVQRQGQRRRSRVRRRMIIARRGLRPDRGRRRAIMDAPP